MSDEKLRELERRWKETESVEDEAAWLKERVRVGDLTQERLELAAYCGHEAAAIAAQTSFPVPAKLEPWLTGFSRFDSFPALRVVSVEVVRHALRNAGVRAGTEPWDYLRYAECALSSDPPGINPILSRGSLPILDRNESAFEIVIAAMECCRSAMEVDGERFARQAILRVAEDGLPLK